MKPATVSAGRARKGEEFEISCGFGGCAPALRFGRLDGIARLLHRTGHEPADGMFLPSHLFHYLGQSSSVLPLEHGHHLGRFAALARRGGFLRLSGPFALGRVLGGGGPLGRLGGWRAPPWPTVRHLWPFLRLSASRALPSVLWPRLIPGYSSRSG